MLLDPGQTVRLTETIGGMAAGSEGIVVGWYTDAEHGLQAIVSFWDGGPVRVPIDVLERPQRRFPNRW